MKAVEQKQNMLMYMGIVNSDNDLPINPVIGQMYLVECEWYSRKLHKRIPKGTALIYSGNEYELVENETIILKDEDVIEIKKEN